MAIAGTIICGSAWLFATNLRNPGYVHRTPEQGLHPRDAPPYAMRHWMGMYGNPREELGLSYEDVEFRAVDDSTLRGWLVPSDTPSAAAVVAVHGGESDRRSFLRHVPILHRAGYPVLLFDYREHGISDGAERGIAFGWRAHHDVSSAVSFMKGQRQFARVAVLGTSMGAVSSILASAGDPEIDVVIAENPFTSAVDVLGNSAFFNRLPDWYRRLVAHFVRLHFDVLDEPDAIDVVDQIAPRPLLLMHGTDDRAVAVWQSEALFDKAGDPKELWILEGAAHTALINKSPAEFERRVIGFLNRYLRDPAQ
ncbi:MAG: alpha/beta fold hydrolase [Deltaproteobacteria bacterium]|nr:alpha/beta fold hydrolase [Deltaproteobacteria bacterium]